MDSNFGFDPNKFIGVVIRWLFNALLLLGAIYIFTIFAMPVIEQVTEALSSLNIGSGSFGRSRYRGSNDIHSLGLIAILLIFFLGLAKVLMRKK